MRNRRFLSAVRHRKTYLGAVAVSGAALVAAGAVAGCGPTGSVSQHVSAPRPSVTVSQTPERPAPAPSSSSAAPTQSGSPQIGSPQSPGPQSPESPSAGPQSPDLQTPNPQTPNLQTPNLQIPNPQSPEPPIPSPSPSYTGAPIPVIGHTAAGGRSVALTFDDGPGPYTPQILAVLAQYNVKATFCEIGRQVAADPAAVQQVVAAGHRLCDHTVDHPQPLHTLPYAKQAYEIGGAKAQIIRAGGPGTQVNWFRAPGGDFSAQSDRIAVQDGLHPLAWTVDTLDWTRPGVPAIMANVHKELRPGGVILMHDGGGDRSQSVAALKQLIPWLISQGYSFSLPAS